MNFPFGDLFMGVDDFDLFFIGLSIFENDSIIEFDDGRVDVDDWLNAFTFDPFVYWLHQLVGLMKIQWDF